MVASLGNWLGEWVFSGGGWSRLFLLLVLMVGLLPGCSVRQLAVNKAGDALASSGTTFASDEDPELIRDAVPFSLKLMESLLAESPRHRGLLYATSSGFTQYAYAFVHQDADQLEDHDLAAASEKRRRAQGMYRRARDYGLRGLDVAHPEFSRQLRLDPKSAVRNARRDDVPLLYWTAVSWAALISLSKHDPDLVADVPVVEALVDRALALDEAYDFGAIHNFLITYEMARQGGTGDPAARARHHFERAVGLTDGLQAGPYVSLAESVAVARQDRSEFEALLSQALAIKPDQRPEWRLANTVMQRRARWLLTQSDQLFAE